MEAVVLGRLLGGQLTRRGLPCDWLRVHIWPSLIGLKLEKEDSPTCPFSLSQGLNVMMTFLVSFFQRYSNGFRRYDKEERFFNPHEKKTFSENSLKYEESILWTKGEILGKGAYGTVSETGSLLK